MVVTCYKTVRYFHYDYIQKELQFEEIFHLLPIYSVQLHWLDVDANSKCCQLRLTPPEYTDYFLPEFNCSFAFFNFWNEWLIYTTFGVSNLHVITRNTSTVICNVRSQVLTAVLLMIQYSGMQYCIAGYFPTSRRIVLPSSSWPRSNYIQSAITTWKKHGFVRRKWHLN